MANPTPKADQLRRQREATRGHLQARVTEKSLGIAIEKKPERKLAPYAGKPIGERKNATTMIGNKNGSKKR